VKRWSGGGEQGGRSVIECLEREKWLTIGDEDRKL